MKMRDFYQANVHSFALCRAWRGVDRAWRAANLVTLSIPKDSATTASLEFKLDWAKLRPMAAGI